MDIIECARLLGKTLQQDERYLRLKKATEVNDADEKLQEMINAFNMKRIEINQEVQKTEKNGDRMMQLDSEFKQLYQDIMSTPLMVEYNAAKQEMDEALTFVNQIIIGSVNGEDPDPIEPMEMGCGGNCASCQGCH